MRCTGKASAQRRFSVAVAEILECRRLLALANGGFEAGGLTPWQRDVAAGGSVQAASVFQGRGAAEGGTFALLGTGGEGGATSISQAFHAEAGDVLRGQAFFRSNGTIASSDAGAVQVIGSDGSVVATLFDESARQSPGVFTPWTAFSYTFEAGGDFAIRATVSTHELCAPAAYVGLDAVRLEAANPPPVQGQITAGADQYATPMGTPLVIPAPGVLLNDAASNHAPLSAGLVSGPAHGRLALDVNGSFTYTPEAGFAGEDGFAYIAQAQGAQGQQASVRIQVEAPTMSLTLQAPDAVQEGEAIVLQGVTGARSPGTTIVVEWTGEKPRSPWDVSPTGFSDTQIILPGTLAPGTSTVITAKVTMTDAQGNVVTASKQITVNSPDAAHAGLVYDLRFADGSKSKDVSGPGTYTLDLWAQIHSADGTFADDGPSTDTLSIVSTQVDGGAIASGGITTGKTTPLWTVPAQTMNGKAGNVTEDGIGDWGSNSTSPFDGYMRYLSSTFSDSGNRTHPGGMSVPGESRQVDDHTWEWRVATFTVRIDAVSADAGVTQFGPLLASFTGVNSSYHTAFYRDEPGLTDGSGGGVSLGPVSVGSPVTFVHSGTGPQAIVAQSDSYTTPQDAPLSVAAPGLLTNDSAGGASMSAALLMPPAHGEAAVHADGSFTYTPAAGYVGDDQFTYSVSAAGLQSVTGDAMISVTPAGPTISASMPQTVQEGENFQLSVNLTDPGKQVYHIVVDWPDGTQSVVDALIGNWRTIEQNLAPGTATGPAQAQVSAVDQDGNVLAATSVSFVLAPPPAMATGMAYDLRFPDGSKSMVISAPGTYTVDLWARITQADGDFGDDGPSTGTLGVASTQVDGGAIASGGITSVSLASSWSVPSRSFPGSAGVVSDDGVGDWGSDSANPFDGYMRYLAADEQGAGYRMQPGGTQIPGQSQQVDEHTWEWRIARFTVTIDSLSDAPGGVTQFLPVLPDFEGVYSAYRTVYYRDEPGLESGTAIVRRENVSAGDPVSFILPTPFSPGPVIGTAE